MKTDERTERKWYSADEEVEVSPEGVGAGGCFLTALSAAGQQVVLEGGLGHISMNTTALVIVLNFVLLLIPPSKTHVTKID